MHDRRVFDETARSALEAVGLPARPPGPSLSRIARRMGKVLGVADLVKGQRLPSVDDARRTVRTHAASIAMTLQDERVRWSERADFDETLQARFGVRKFIIAAGRSSRFSPTELIHKQIARPDGSSTNIAHSRLAARIGTLEDVVVVDPMVAYRLLAKVPIDGLEREGLMADVAEAFDRPAAALGKESLLMPIKGQVLELVSSQLRFARHPEQLEDFADVMRRLSAMLGRVPKLAAAEARAITDEIGFAIASWLIDAEDCVSASDVEEHCGPACILAVAPSQGPGAAYMAGVRRLGDMGLLGAARYSFCIYSDYPAFLLDQYPDLYVNAYLRAVNRFELQGSADVLWPAMPMITVAAKQPPDTVRGRGNVILEETELGVVPRAIREWRDMSASERRQAEKGFAAKRHAINAGLFVIDTAWAESHFPAIRRDYDHPDPKKGKVHEYWYTDLVAISASEGTPRRVVWLGEEAPLGNKDVSAALRYRESFHDMMRRKLQALGVAVDPAARVNVVVKEPGEDLDVAIRGIFGGTRRRAPRPDQVYIFGDVEIDSRARIDDGICLDGRGGPVVLKRETTVGRGARLSHVVAEDTKFQPCATLDGFSYESPRLGTYSHATLVADSHLENCLVQSGAAIEGSTLCESYLAGRVAGCKLALAVVAADDVLSSVTAEGLRAMLSTAVYNPDRYTPGLVRVHEAPGRRGARLLSQAHRDLLARLEDRAPAAAARDRAAENARFFFAQARFLSDLTPELVAHFAASELRRAVGGDPYDALKREAANTVQAAMAHEWRRIGSLPADRPSLTQEFQRIARLAVQANVLDPLAPETWAAFATGDPGSRLSARLDALVDPAPAIDDFVALRRMAFEGGVGTFLYVLDKVGEAEADGLLCAVLCHLGHRVVLVAKSKPVGCCATARDVDGMIDRLPVLRRRRGEGRLRVIESGTCTEGLLLDRPSRELESALVSLSLKAVLLKGQSNLHTTCARNRLKTPVVAMAAPRGETARRVAGLPAQAEGRARGVLAFVPAGECVVTVRSDGSFKGSLAELSARA